MRHLAAAAALTAAPAGLSFAGPTLDRPTGVTQPYALDSGPVANRTALAAPAFAQAITIEGAAWLRLHFAATTALPAGSFIRITSARDGETQQFDAAALSAWGGASAYFNGDTLLVELVAGPGATGGRLAIERVSLEPVGGVPTAVPAECGICGVDDRVPSDERWTGRVLPAGCTASVFAETSCLVSAGHCVRRNSVVQFAVPDSDPDCGLNHPPVADQFPIVEAEYLDAGIGEDWSVMVPGPNDLGELPYERYGQLRPIAASVPGIDQPVVAFGYGASSICTRTQTQQTSAGSTVGLFERHCTFDVDVRGGSSGSALLHQGAIVAVITHCDPDCPNSATRVDHPGFTEARDVLADPEVEITYPDGLPEVIDPHGGTTVRLSAADPAVAGTARLHLSVDGGPYVASPMAMEAPHDYVTAFPALGCGAVASFYFSVEAAGGHTVTAPRWAPHEVHTAVAAHEIVTVFADDFQVDRGWSQEAAGGLTGGHWQRAVPLPIAVCDRGNPGADADGSGRCFLTEKNPDDCDSDVDGGTAILVSPALDGSQGGAILGYDRWFSTIAGGNALQDLFVAEVSGDDGATWLQLETVGPEGRQVRGGWYARRFRVPAAVETAQMRVRFVASDTDPPSVVEAGVDAFRLVSALCEAGCPWDLDGGGVGVSDFLALLAQWGTDPGGPPDFDGDGNVGLSDFLALLANWGPCDFP